MAYDVGTVTHGVQVTTNVLNSVINVLMFIINTPTLLWLFVGAFAAWRIYEKRGRKWAAISLVVLGAMLALMATDFTAGVLLVYAGLTFGGWVPGPAEMIQQIRHRSFASAEHEEISGESPSLPIESIKWE